MVLVYVLFLVLFSLYMLPSPCKSSSWTMREYFVCYVNRRKDPDGHLRDLYSALFGAESLGYPQRPLSVTELVSPVTRDTLQSSPRPTWEPVRPSMFSEGSPSRDSFLRFLLVLNWSIPSSLLQGPPCLSLLFHTCGSIDHGVRGLVTPYTLMGTITREVEFLREVGPVLGCGECLVVRPIVFEYCCRDGVYAG